MDCLEIKISGGVVGDINISGLLEVITADRFINNGNITIDTLTITTDEFLQPEILISPRLIDFKTTIRI